MSSLNNKKILLGVTGSIAAYKAAELIRRLGDAGAEVRVVMTRGAKAFVTPLTFQALSGHPVHEDLLDTEAEAGMGHIELSRWADAILIAPASADVIARLAQGRADDLLSAICLASEVPLAIAPAMNTHMWADQATQSNVHQLAQRGMLFFGPDKGEQACGDIGEGRLLETEQLIVRLGELFESGSLSGETVVITAGPTREAIDPVRFISNHSSGKMGFALATAAAEAGAKVILVSGPVTLTTPDRVTRIDVESAEDMHQAVLSHLPQASILIATAAVADYRPVIEHQEKLKKNSDRLTIELTQNPDILATAKQQFPGLFCVGFAAETHDVEKYASEKLLNKNIEMIAANLVGPAATETGGTFNSDLNALTVFWKNGQTELELANKNQLARQLIAIIAQRFLLAENNETNESNIVSFTN